MIHKHELRIGNWVLNENGDLFMIRSGALIDEADKFEPVNLNVDVLKKSGFTFQPFFKVWQKKEQPPKTAFLMEIDQDFNVKDFGQRYIGIRLTSLHQLQNLLYQLKGVEIDFDVDERQEMK